MVGGPGPVRELQCPAVERPSTGQISLTSGSDAMRVCGRSPNENPLAARHRKRGSRYLDDLSSIETRALERAPRQSATSKPCDEKILAINSLLTGNFTGKNGGERRHRTSENS